MRHIGHLPAGSARVFSDFLISRGIHHEVERETDGSFAIWVRDEDQVTPAQEFLRQFSSNPNAAEFSNASVEAERARAAEKKDLEAYQKRVRTGRHLFPKVGGYGVGWLTYALIVVCVIVAIYTKLGADGDRVRNFFITDPVMGGDGSLPEVAAGQVWRLFTPIFLHFGPLHLIFNLMWIYQLGSMIEGRRSTGNLLAVVATTALCSNLAEYFFTGNPMFGGMSGVVYGLAGYVWIRGKYDPASGLFLDRQSVTILLVWLVICYTDLLGHVANTAHLSGLIVGMIWGGLSAFIARQNPS